MTTCTARLLLSVPGYKIYALPNGTVLWQVYVHGSYYQVGGWGDGYLGGDAGLGLAGLAILAFGQLCVWRLVWMGGFVPGHYDP